MIEMLLPTHSPTSKPMPRNSPETRTMVSAVGAHSRMFSDVPMRVFGPGRAPLAATRTTWAETIISGFIRS